MSTIHSSWALLGACSVLSWGTARFSTVRSMAYSRHGRAITASPTHSRRPALGVVAAFVNVRSPRDLRVRVGEGVEDDLWHSVVHPLQLQVMTHRRAPLFSR